MNLELYRYIEIIAYTLIYFIPYTFLAFYTFRQSLRFKPYVNITLIIVMTVIQALIHIRMAGSDAEWWIALGKTAVISFLFVNLIKEHFGKTLFVILMLSNIQNLVICAAKCLEGILFPALSTQHFRWSNTVTVILAEIIILVPIYLFIKRILSKGLNETQNITIWRYIWCVPLTFYSIWFRNFYFSAEGSLTLALRPRHLVFTLVVNSGALLIYAMVMRLITEQAENDRLREKDTQHVLQQKQYELLNERIEEARTAKHDMRQHLHMISAYLADKKYDELELYIARLQKAFPDSNTISYCDNYAVNALLQYFASQSREHGIAFSAQTELPQKLSIPDDMIAVLLGNLLENAVEACTHEQRAVITVRGKTDGDALFFKVINTFTGKTKKSPDGLFLSTKHEGRGIGLRSVRGIVSEYRGILKIKHDDGLFTVSAMLNIPS